MSLETAEAEVYDDEIRFTQQGLEQFQSHVKESDRYETAALFSNEEISSIMIEDKSDGVIYMVERSDKPDIGGKVSFNYTEIQGGLSEVSETLEAENKDSFPISHEQVPETHNMTQNQPSDGSEIRIPGNETGWNYVDSELRLN